MYALHVPIWYVYVCLWYAWYVWNVWDAWQMPIGMDVSSTAEKVAVPLSHWWGSLMVARPPPPGADRDRDRDRDGGWQDRQDRPDRRDRPAPGGREGRASSPRHPFGDRLPSPARGSLCRGCVQRAGGEDRETPPPLLGFGTTSRMT